MATDRRALAAGLLLLLACACGDGQAPAGETPLRGGGDAGGRPDILLIVADDLGWGDLSGGPMGHRTPRLDRLAREGLTLDRFYTFPICTPTRAALLTGRSPVRYGLLYGPLRPWEEGGLPPGERTLAEHLREAGWQTALVGKWHLGHARRETWPQAQGFEHFTGCLNGSVDYFTRKRLGALDWQRDGRSLEVEGYVTDLVAGEAVRILRERDPDRPLFLEVAFTAPHTPFQAPAGLVAAQDPALDEAHRTLAAMVASLDAGVGRILDAVDASGRRETTIVCFLSDNGAPGEPGPGGQGIVYPRNSPWRGGKWTVFEGGQRVPAFLRWPGRVREGSRLAAPVTVLDLFPTLAALAGVPAPSSPPLDGRDRSGWLQGGAEAAPGTGEAGDAAFFTGVEHFGVRRHSLVRGRWKLVQEQRIGRRGRPRLALYDLVADPGESRDVAAEHPEVVAELQAELRRWRERYPKDGLHFSHEPPEGWRPPADWTAGAR